MLNILYLFLFNTGWSKEQRKLHLYINNMIRCQDEILHGVWSIWSGAMFSVPHSNHVLIIHIRSWRPNNGCHHTKTNNQAQCWRCPGHCHDICDSVMRVLCWHCDNVITSRDHTTTSSTQHICIFLASLEKIMSMAGAEHGNIMMNIHDQLNSQGLLEYQHYKLYSLCTQIHTF